MAQTEKRKCNQQWGKITDGSTSIQLKKEHGKDPHIQRWMAQEDHTHIKRLNEVLFCIWRPRNSPDTVYEQIVLPKKYHQWVLKLAHDIPLASHQRREKRAWRLLRRFYWTTLFQDVKHYCQTCAECQLQGGRKAKAAMTPLPVIQEPFRAVTMDIVDPRPRTGRGNHFILVISDYVI